MVYIAFDSHKRYTLASVEFEKKGGTPREMRINHERGAIQTFLKPYPQGSPVAVETIGNWYWITDEIERAGMIPQLVHAYKAKLMMGQTNKTDKLDARGLNRLQRAGTLPTVWIPPKELRDQRELPRTRMMMSRQRTEIKNRIHATLAKYALALEGVSDTFSVRGKELLREKIKELPPQTAYVTECLLEELGGIQETIASLENRMREVFEENHELKLVMSLPGVGFILGIVILLETGSIERFPSEEHYASYSGTTPRVHSSGGKTRCGPLRSDVNRYLKWAFMEAANSVVLNQNVHPDWHVTALYQRVRQKRGSSVAKGAVAHHLSEAAYWVMKKKELYRDPTLKKSVKPTILSTEV